MGIPHLNLTNTSPARLFLGRFFSQGGILMSELERFFRFLQILLAQVNREWRGRPPRHQRGFRYDHGLILKLLILQAASGWSLRTLDHKLWALRNTLYRRLVGVRRSELPHWTTIARRSRSLPFLLYLQRVLRRLSKEAILRRPGDLRLIVIDLTDLPTDPRRDSGGRWGHVITEEAFFGWKLHLVVNRRGIILGAYLTTAEKGETACVTTLLLRLWWLLPKRWRRGLIKEIVADAGYDAEKVYKLIHNLLGALAAIDFNPRRGGEGEPQGRERRRGWRYLQSREGQRALKKRQVIERTNRTLKEDLGLEERLRASEPWNGVKVGVRVWLELIRYDVGRLIQLRSGSYSEGVKALVI